MPDFRTLWVKIRLSLPARTCNLTRRITPTNTKAFRRGPSTTRGLTLFLPPPRPSKQNTYTSFLTNRATSIMLSPMRSIWPTKRNTSIKGRVFVGLSGGVDSAVSAALLQRQGYEVTGVFIRIAIDGYPCTAGVDKLDAMRVAAHLRIPFLSVDLSQEYRNTIFEFSKGRTPNPDALCNREIKFGLFFDWCMAQGAEMLATGHYAQTKDGQLYAGADENKDQSYFLWAVPEMKLRKTLFPVGSFTKQEVRRLAKKFGLPNSDRKDSQGLCFLGPVSMDEMLRKELQLVPGDVLDESGAVAGKHEGVQAYTLGQRHGFVLTLQTPDTRPHFVVAKDITRNTITVSTNKFPEHARTTEITLSDVNWIGEHREGSYMARYRYRQKLIPTRLQRTVLRNGSQGLSLVTLEEPHFVPGGQSLVLYDGARCVGGGVILNARYGDTDRKSRRPARTV